MAGKSVRLQCTLKKRSEGWWGTEEGTDFSAKKTLVKKYLP